MPSGSYRQADVKCPFYRRDDGRGRITCEGLLDESSLTLNYRKRSDYKIQMDVFCTGSYEKCEVYRMLMEKYEE